MLHIIPILCLIFFIFFVEIQLKKEITSIEKEFTSLKELILKNKEQIEQNRLTLEKSNNG
jgi:hypothetical protein